MTNSAAPRRLLCVVAALRCAAFVPAPQRGQRRGASQPLAGGEAPGGDGGGGDGAWESDGAWGRNEWDAPASASEWASEADLTSEAAPAVLPSADVSEADAAKDAAAAAKDAKADAAKVESFLRLVRELDSDVLPVKDARVGVVPSHELVSIDDDGDPVLDRERMVFVDEEACIGCTSCATLATQTFLMDDAHGRARAFSQAGDTDEIIEEAIATCPVDCIHYVPWDELVSLERLRADAMDKYNPKGRLVGNEGLASAGAGGVLLQISSNSASRCTNCPSNKCAGCPMYSVGDETIRENAIANRESSKPPEQRKRCGSCPTNGCPGCPLMAQFPEHRKQRLRRDRKRTQRIKQRKEAIRKDLDTGSLGVDL